MHLRYPSVQGSFYPETREKCLEMILKFQTEISFIDNGLPRALIVPHAGWIYSGLTAVTAYQTLKNFKGSRVIILAPSHHAGFSGISAGEYDAYLINGVPIPVDLEYLKLLKERFDLAFYEQAHKYEHSDEVQLPFLNHFLPEYKFLSLIYSYDGYLNIVPLLKELLADRDNLVLISSDLSHYLSQAEATLLDQNIIDGVLNSDIKLISKGEACGRTGIMALCATAKDLNLKSKLLDYRTSGDVSGDYQKVVGYASFLFTD